MSKHTINVQKLLVITVGFIISTQVVAAPIPTNKDKEISNQQLIYQQEKQKALEESLKSDTPDIRLLPPMKKTQTINFPQEELCFPINQVELLARETIPYNVPLYRLANQAENSCLGGEGINLLMSEIQNQLISYGYITTRVVAPEQDLTTGILQLLLVKGTVRHVSYSPESDTHTRLSTTMPVKSSEILNLRDIEQGLENLQRVRFNRVVYTF